MKLINAHLKDDMYLTPMIEPVRGQASIQKDLPKTYIPKDLLERWEKGMEDFREVQKEMQEWVDKYLMEH